MSCRWVANASHPPSTGLVLRSKLPWLLSRKLLWNCSSGLTERQWGFVVSLQWFSSPRKQRTNFLGKIRGNSQCRARDEQQFWFRDFAVCTFSELRKGDMQIMILNESTKSRNSGKEVRGTNWGFFSLAAGLLHYISQHCAHVCERQTATLGGIWGIKLESFLVAFEEERRPATRQNETNAVQVVAFQIENVGRKGLAVVRPQKWGGALGGEHKSYVEKVYTFDIHNYAHQILVLEYFLKITLRQNWRQN